VVFANAVAGVWALVAHRSASARHRALWWFTGVAQVLVFVQAILGAPQVSDDNRDALGFHIFYGVLCMVSIGILYSYRQQLRAHIYLLYGFGGLFIMGLALRAMFL
jgi:hypothetical protein